MKWEWGGEVAFLGTARSTKTKIFLFDFRRRMDMAFFLSSFLKNEKEKCGTQHSRGWGYLLFPGQGLLCLAIHSLNIAESASI